jgi:hypothetical protein
MEKYKNASGKSGVLAYELGTNWIKVKFTSGGDIQLLNSHTRFQSNYYLLLLLTLILK